MKHGLYHVGKISKTHGYNGTIVIVANSPFGDGMEDIVELFLLIDGIMTPFAVEEFVMLTGTLAHVRFEFVSNQNQALELVGCGVYATIALRKPEEADYVQWAGYSVCDAKHGKVGIIREIEDYNGNIVMRIMDGKKEVLISMYPELITKIDKNLKVIHILALDGYF